MVTIERKGFFRFLLPVTLVVFAVEYTMSLYWQSIGDLCQPGVHPFCTPFYLSLMAAIIVLVFGTVMLLFFGNLSPRPKEPAPQ